ncbi:MAG: hypothetical protein Terrestrivirus1_310 [Terrestrivirus sp.]|uniref:Uncharacterized protein n=1 Tax=Terrestrivirus sp. TaxID=2487775 RepID=A0A3G4ZKS3_9VIRU|nr:MAG: hypothetical protein Terrestrivirus1_310 [Terrestrivirus sp.]
MVFFAIQKLDQRIDINDTTVQYDTVVYADTDVNLNQNGSITFKHDDIYNVDVNLSLLLGSDEAARITCKLNGVNIPGAGLNINIGSTSTANRASNFVVKACKGDILSVTGTSSFGVQANVNNSNGAESSLRISRS